MRLPAAFSRKAEWAIFVLLLLAEFLLFDQLGAKPATKVIPRWNDQIQYLSDAYLGYETLQQQGLGAALKRTLLEPTSQGTLQDLWAVTVFAVAGPSRSAALSVNMLFLLAWQVLLFVALRRIFSSRALAWAGMGLLLALRLPWDYVPGSATDFRLDFMAAALFGCCSCACYLTDRFSSRAWSLVFGVLVGLCFGTRFLTGTYFLLIYPGLLLWVLLCDESRPRFRNLVFAGLATFVIAAPLFHINKEQMMDYYYYGHYVGPESAIRNSPASLWSSLCWMGGRFWSGDLGSLWQGLAFLGSLGFLGCLLLGRTSAVSDEEPPLTPALLFLLAPAAVLALHPQKSDVVLSILIPGALLLTLVFWQALISRRTETPSNLVAVVVFCCGFGLFLNDMIYNPVPDFVRRDSRVAITICNDITRISDAAGLKNPRIGVDHITDLIDAQIFRVLAYERSGRWIPMEMTLPAGIDRLSTREVEKRLQDSDFFLLTEAPAPPANWPFDAQMQEQHAQWKNWCDKHLLLTGQFAFLQRKVSLYQRRDLPAPPPKPPRP